MDPLVELWCKVKTVSIVPKGDLNRMREGEESAVQNNKSYQDSTMCDS